MLYNKFHWTTGFFRKLIFRDILVNGLLPKSNVLEVIPMATNVALLYPSNPHNGPTTEKHTFRLVP